jgi:hypothetical protein
VCVRVSKQAKNVAAAVRGCESTLEHHNQMKRGKEVHIEEVFQINPCVTWTL